MMGVVYGTCAGKVVLSSMRTIFYCDTMKKSLYVMIFLALCMIVPAVNADSLTIDAYPANSASDPVVISLGTISDDKLTVTANNNIPQEHYPLVNFGIVYKSTNYGSSVTITLPHDSSYIDLTVGARNPVANYGISRHYRITYQYVEPTPEPNPNGYLDYNVMFADELSTTYQIITRNPSNNPILEFSQITTEPQTWNPFVMFYPVTSLVYTIPAGKTVTFYALSTTDLFTTTELTLTITAPSNENIINQNSTQIQPNNTAYNPPPIPQVTPGSNNNPINSGKFKPSNNNYVTPFTEFIDNAKTITRLPTMTEPQILKTEVLNGTGNITAPLYNTIDGFTTLLIFPAVTASNNIQLLLQPLEEMLQYCDAVMVEIFKTVNNFFVTIYPLRDFFYMLIPDFVWWIMAALLVFEIVVTIMTFVYGRGVTWYYLFGFGEHDKK